jgi:hypothetical protein
MALMWRFVKASDGGYLYREGEGAMNFKASSKVYPGRIQHVDASLLMLRRTRIAASEMRFS